MPKENRKPVGGERLPVAAYLKPASFKAKQEITGIFKGTYVDQYGKKAHRLELTQPTTATTSEGTTKKLTAGDLVIINGAGQLDKKLQTVTEGSEIDIAYLGTKKIEQGKYKGKAAHQFEVYADPSNTKESSSNTSSEDDESESTDSDNEVAF